MNADTLILIYLLGVAIFLIAFYYIIRFASGAPKREKQLNLQNRILLHIAEKQGVAIETVKELEQINQELIPNPQAGNE